MPLQQTWYFPLEFGRDFRSATWHRLMCEWYPMCFVRPDILCFLIQIPMGFAPHIPIWCLSSLVWFGAAFLDVLIHFCVSDMGSHLHSHFMIAVLLAIYQMVKFQFGILFQVSIKWPPIPWQEWMVSTDSIGNFPLTHKELRLDALLHWDDILTLRRLHSGDTHFVL